MTEDGVALRADADRGKSVRQSVKFADPHPGDVFKASGIVGVATDAVGFRSILVRYVADIGLEPLPLAGNAFVGREGVAGAETRNQELSAILEARFVKVDQQRLVHSDWLHEF